MKIALASLLICQSMIAQPDKYRLSQQDYIDKYKKDAVLDMQKTGVPASITLAQGVLESESGNSRLATEANNHFGIKCHDDWTGETFFQDDDKGNECFRKYNSVLESFDDHSDFLRKRYRYAFLFDLNITDYKSWAHGLKKAGYATNPDYAYRLIKIIEDYNLFELDRPGNSKPIEALGKKSGPPENNLHHVSRREPAKTATASYQTSDNNVPYVTAKKGDTYYTIAMDNKIMLWQVLKYNDAEKHDDPKEGEVVYVMHKKAKANFPYHIVQEGEDMHYISQLYAVKMKKLYKRNHMTAGTHPQPGQKILLK